MLRQREERLATPTAEISAPLSVAVSPSLLGFNRALFHSTMAVFESYTCLPRYVNSVVYRRFVFLWGNVKVRVPLGACVFVGSFWSAAIILRYEAGQNLFVPPRILTDLNVIGPLAR